MKFGLGTGKALGVFVHSQKNVTQDEKPSLELFSLFDGFPTTNVSQIIEDSEGILWFAGSNGLASVDPKNLVQHAKVTNVQITKLYQDEEVFDLNKKPNLKFPYQENYIDFEYNAIDVINEHKIEYRYQLLGYESKWSNPTKSTKTEYPNLPHGSYTFAVASRMGNGDWGEAAEISFRISPPWWKSILAYFIYSVLLLLAIAWIWRKQLQRIREKNQIEKELLEVENIRKIDEVKTQFFSNLSHEFRTPLTVILGMTEEIKENALPKKLINQSGQNLLRLVNQMLDFNKLEAGKLSLNLSPGELVSYIQYILESFQSLAEYKKIELIFETAIEELKIDFDEDKMQHIISNLVSNAIKFTNHNGEVKLRLSEVQDQISIEVIDSGIGIAAEEIPFIFDRFYQIRNPIQKGQPGSGIGLSYSKELVKLMNGTISVKSKKDVGSTFQILLPLEKLSNKTSSQTTNKHRIVIQESINETPPTPIMEESESSNEKTDVVISGGQSRSGRLHSKRFKKKRIK